MSLRFFCRAPRMRMAGREGMGGGSGGEGGRGGGWSEAGRGVGAERDCPWRSGIVRDGGGVRHADIVGRIRRLVTRLGAPPKVA